MLLRLGISLLLTVGLASVANADGWEPWKASSFWTDNGTLPQYQQWSWMYEDAKDIATDLNNGGGKYKLIYKKKGGSSHQTLVIRVADGKTMGIWSAPNHATYLYGEIFAFTLSRMLGRSQWTTPGTRMTLSGPGRDQALAANKVTPPRARRCNQENILNYMRQNRYYITGAYMAFIDGKKPGDLDKLVDKKHTQRMNPRSSIVKMINKSGPQPSGRAVYASGGDIHYGTKTGVPTSTDLDAAKQLSFLALLDALNSQRDRFGPYGSNMESLIDLRENTFVVAAVDNGGIADSAFTHSYKYFLGKKGKGVSRFEREIFDRVIQMNEFVQGRTSSFTTADGITYNSVEEFKAALGYEADAGQGGNISPPKCKSKHQWLFYSPKTRFEKRFKAFTKALNGVANYMKQFDRDQNAFFAN